jgi:hypothetical protein
MRGSKPGERRGGRKKGTPNRLTQEIRDRVALEAASGLTPLEYMLRVMRAEDTDERRRDAMAQAAAPYLHSRLATVENTGTDGDPVKIVHEVSWKQP